MKLYEQHRFDSLEHRTIDGSSFKIINNEQLVEIDERVFRYSRHFRSAPDFPIKSDDIVIAHYRAWHKWFRAKVLSHNKDLNLVKVLAIDYGHELQLRKQCVFPLFDMWLAHAEPVRTIKHSTEQSAETVSTKVDFQSMESDKCEIQANQLDAQSPTVADGHNIEEMKTRIFTSTPMQMQTKVLSSKWVFLMPASETNSLESNDTSIDRDVSRSLTENLIELSDIDSECRKRDKTDFATSKRIGIEKEISLVKRGDQMFETPLPKKISEYTKFIMGQNELVETVCVSASFAANPIEKHFGYEVSDDKTMCTSEIDRNSYSDNIIEQKNELLHIEKEALANDFGPLKELSLINMTTMCIGGEIADYRLSKCFDNFSPQISKQLKRLQRTYRLQELAWPHLLEGRSAIIIDPSDNLAELVYLPVICTHVNKASVQPKRIGPLAIIICKTQARSIEIAKRCLGFSSAGFMANNSVCVSDENNQFPPDAKFEECQIFVTSIVYIIRFRMSLFRVCNSVQKIVFDGMDFINHNFFMDIIHGMGAAPQQIVVTSKIWRPVHREIYNNRTQDYSIFGGPLDIAIAANTKFDPIIAGRLRMSLSTAQNYMLRLILGRIGSITAPKILIICGTDKGFEKLETHLKLLKIKLDDRFRTGKAKYNHFTFGGKNVFFCTARLIPSIDLTVFTYCIIYNLFEDARNRQEIYHMSKRFQLMFETNSEGSQPLAPITIAFFCFDKSQVFNRKLAGSFWNYQRYMKCPKFWSLIAATNALPFTNDLCLNFNMYSEPSHHISCDKRHSILKEDEPKLCIDNFWIKFRISHFYSPVHYEVEIYAEKESDHGQWVYLDPQYKTVEIHLSYLSPKFKDNNPASFRRIFDRIFDLDERCDSYMGKVFLKLKYIYFVERFGGTRQNEKQPVTQALRWFFDNSPRIMDQLKQMVANFEKETAKLREVECDSDDDWW